MGYEIKAYIGKTDSDGNEWALTKKRYKDGSGFEPQKKDGQIVYTGRTSHWFQVYAMIDLCKLGYQDDALNRLISDTFKRAKDVSKTDYHFFYGTDGNTEIKEDRYGAPVGVAPLKTVLKAMQSTEDAKTYRRLVWAIALLKSMSKDGEQLEVLFYGY